MTGYGRKFNKNAAMSFRVNNKQLLKNYNKIQEKVEKLFKTDFEGKPVYGDCNGTRIHTTQFVNVQSTIWPN